MRKPESDADLSDKLSSGVSGFDETTHGGLPRGRVSLVLGGAGCGETSFALQGLVAGATRLADSAAVAAQDTLLPAPGFVPASSRGHR